MTAFDVARTDCKVHSAEFSFHLLSNFLIHFKKVFILVHNVMYVITSLCILY